MRLPITSDDKAYIYIANGLTILSLVESFGSMSLPRKSDQVKQLVYTHKTLVVYMDVYIL